MPQETYYKFIGQVDHYYLIKKIGRGGFGHVFLAYNTTNDTQVVLKLSRNTSDSIKTSF